MPLCPITPPLSVKLLDVALTEPLEAPVPVQLLDVGVEYRLENTKPEGSVNVMLGEESGSDTPALGFVTVSVIAVSSPHFTELGEYEMLVVGLLSVLICKLTDAAVLFVTAVGVPSLAEKSPIAITYARLVPPAETEVTLNE